MQQHTIHTPFVVGAVHCYTAELAGELVLFDTGAPTDAGWDYLKNHVDLGRLRHVFVTHCHIDHYGLVSRLEQETGATIYLPYRDELKIKRHDERLSQMYGLLEGLGFDKPYLDALRVTLDKGGLFPVFPSNFKRVEEELPAHLGFEALNCPGHSQSDVVYVGPDWAVTGDVLLQGIFQSPLLDVDLITGERFRNYDAYCATLVKLATLRRKTIYPGHRERITSVDDCILFYIRKMLDRVGQLKPLLDGTSVPQVVTQLFGTEVREPFHVYLKASEVVFMQDFLEQPAALADSLKTIDLFAEVAEQFHAIAPV